MLMAMGNALRVRDGIWFAPGAPCFDAWFVDAKFKVERLEEEPLRLTGAPARGWLDSSDGSTFGSPLRATLALSTTGAWILARLFVLMHRGAGSSP